MVKKKIRKLNEVPEALNEKENKSVKPEVGMKYGQPEIKKYDASAKVK